MRILVVISHTGLLRHYIDFLKLTISENHEVLLNIGRNKDENDSNRILEILQNDNFKIIYFPNKKDTIINKLLEINRNILSLYPFYHDSHPSKKLIIRIHNLFPNFIKLLINNSVIKFLLINKISYNLFRILENICPIDKDFTKIMKEANPDILFTSPYIFSDYYDVDFIKCANKLGIPTTSAIASWDNLTSKGTSQVPVNKLFVWNKYLKKEAVELHKINSKFIEIIGSPTFDYLFNWNTKIDKLKFMLAAKIANYDYYILYLCSSPSISKNEFEIIIELANSMTLLKTEKKCCLLVRPHPLNFRIWENKNSLPENLILFPNINENYSSNESIDIYCHSMFYSSAVIGLNTSAFIEACILNKPCISLPSYPENYTRENFGHFKHLADGKFINMPNNKEDVNHIIENILLNDDDDLFQMRKLFTNNFIRPNGLNVNSSNKLLQGIYTTLNQHDKKVSKNFFIYRKKIIN
jgi:hypothetical protein